MSLSKKTILRLLLALAVLLAAWRLVVLFTSPAQDDQYVIDIIAVESERGDLLIGKCPTSPRVGTVFYYSPGNGQLCREEVEFDWEKDYLEQLFLCWRERSGFPETAVLNSADLSYGYETRSEMSGSTILSFTSTPPRITLDISKEIAPCLDPEGRVLDSLVKTLRAAYGEDLMLTLSVEGEVRYSEDAPEVP